DAQARPRTPARQPRDAGAPGDRAADLGTGRGRVSRAHGHEQAAVVTGGYARRGSAVARGVYRHAVKRALLLLVVLAACSEHKKPEPKQEPERHRRMIEPPTRGVRAFPPHAIRPDGVGPYKLGSTVATLLDQLPS